MKKQSRLDWVVDSIVADAEVALSDVRVFSEDYRHVLRGLKSALCSISIKFPKYQKQFSYVRCLSFEAIHHKKIDAFLEDYEVRS